MRAPRPLAALPLLAMLLAGCTTIGCEPEPVPASATLALGDAGADEAVVREVLAERGWTLAGPDGVAATFALQDGTEVRADALAGDAQGRVAGLAFSTSAPAADDVRAAQTLSPAVEPVVAGLSERLGRDLSAAYSGGVRECA